ncbi:hypothetical protein VPH35_029258 [Triticum aestivum]|uniref:Uncharacterized protein n=1 Tax=Triticum turgidum subsp. durum TaxID=4567 RepID=A0A9R1PRI2_TRITD|nr:unnamed protein product [Triticum turgidum subsp. durum]
MNAAATASPPPPQNPHPAMSFSSAPGVGATSEIAAACAETHIRAGPIRGYACGPLPPPLSWNPRAGHGRVAGSEERRKTMPAIPYTMQNPSSRLIRTASSPFGRSSSTTGVPWWRWRGRTAS